jgi:hypothetical protein
MPAKTDRIQDEGLRNSLAEAQAALQLQTIMFFPRLGAHIQLNSDSQPEIIYDREKFIFSEAVTYYEFVVDYMIRIGL